MKAEKKKRLGPTKAPKSVEVKYRKALLTYINKLSKATEAEIGRALKATEHEYVGDAYATTLEQAFANLKMRFKIAEETANLLASNVVQQSNTINKQKFYNTINKALGIDLSSVVGQENLGDELKAKTRENVALIVSIPEEYFKKIEAIVYSNIVQGTRANSMIKEIKRVGKVTESRAKMIARDQTAKLNATLNQKRAQNVGSEEYIWRTSEDGRVRHNHATKNGKRFKWSKPPQDTGHPGQDYQCRCIAEPIINF